MTGKKFVHRSSIALAAALLLATAACKIQVDPSKDGKDKNVKVQTPFGGVQVKTDNMAASDVGLPPYPGATRAGHQDKNEKNGAADVHVGFGNWQMHLKVVKYHTSDSKEQVLAFYRKALSRYGDVIQCDGARAVGTPAMTREGLGCKEQDSGPHSHLSDQGELLKVGSKKHQHLVGIGNSGNDGTDFSLVVLDLPSDDAMGGNDQSRESN